MNRLVLAAEILLSIEETPINKNSDKERKEFILNKILNIIDKYVEEVLEEYKDGLPYAE